MPQENQARCLFGRSQHNVIAKQFRENWPIVVTDKRTNLIVNNALTNLALSMAVRFKQDNPSFDPRKWLDQCSPSPDTMPLSELWSDSFMFDPQDRD